MSDVSNGVSDISRNCPLHYHVSVGYKKPYLTLYRPETRSSCDYDNRKTPSYGLLKFVLVTASRGDVRHPSYHGRRMKNIMEGKNRRRRFPALYR